MMDLQHRSPITDAKADTVVVNLPHHVRSVARSRTYISHHTTAIVSRTFTSIDTLLLADRGTPVYPQRHMRGIARLCAAFGVVLGGSITTAQAAPETYPIAKLTRGQTGYGVTTFAGNTPERFTFEVVSVVKNFLPKQDIVLVKSSDPKVQVSGFWQGMSGSPLYIDDKLVCAFSYGFRFNKVALPNSSFPALDKNEIAQWSPTLVLD